jgi:hypothetical protein
MSLSEHARPGRPPRLSASPFCPLPVSFCSFPFIKQTGDPETWTLCRQQRQGEAEEAEPGMGAEGDL